MSRRPRREAPPQALVEPQAPLLGIAPAAYSAAVDVSAEPLTMERLNEVAIHLATQEPAAEPLLAVGLGLLKDGRHVAFEAEVVGRTVTKWTPLCAYREVHAPERTWWQVGFARLCHRRDLMAAELEANARDSRGVVPDDFEHGAAVAIIGAGRKCSALAMHLTGHTVEEPKVVSRGVREYCWAELTTWAALNMLPRRKMR